ncbi:MAG: hypothetical protein Alis3KO_00840 [Aliiglaciecola sp.]
MDIMDEAQRRTEHFHNLAMANRQFDLAPLPPGKTDKQGRALCVDCDVDITKRREIVPSAQRCIECQTDMEKLESR